MTYQAKVIRGGKLVIPAELRRTLDIRDGDTVTVDEQDGAVVIRTRRDALRRLQDAVQQRLPEGDSLVDALLAERRREAAMEDEDADRASRNGGG